MKKKIFIVAAVLLGMFGVGTIVHANPTFYPAGKALNDTATTSFYTMSAGTATATISYDAFANGNNTQSTNALLVIQFTASTSAPTLKARVEYSEDNIDWYPSNLAITVATTSLIANPFSEYQFNFGTSTFAGDFGGTGVASTTFGTSPNARIHQSLVIPTPLRYTRVKLYIPVSGGSGSLWAKILPWKERAE